MNSKEKANELFNKFYMILFDSDSDKGEECLVSLLAVKCAFLCCDEILLELKSVGFSITNEKGQTPEQYFDEVKLELEKL